jgi:hypothetical protein
VCHFPKARVKEVDVVRGSTTFGGKRENKCREVLPKKKNVEERERASMFPEFRPVEEIRYIERPFVLFCLFVSFPINRARSLDR